jgi:hypothetical protein
MTNRASLFEGAWTAARQEAEPDSRQHAGTLMRVVADILGVTQIEFATLPGGALFLLDLGDLGLGQLSVNVFMISHPPLDDAAARDQATLLQQYKDAVRSVGFCFQLFLSNTMPPRNEYITSSLDAVFLCGDDLLRLFASEAPQAAFFEIIRRQVHLDNLNPFDTTHEARGGMFRGRRVELQRLANHLDTSFVVGGARRIGKTTLLKKAHLSTWVKSEFRNRSFIFNCITWGGFDEAAYALAHQIDPKKQVRIGRGLHNLKYLLERASNGGSRTLLLFLDEADRIVERDLAQGWPLLSVLAEAMSARWIRLTFAGYRSMGRLTVGTLTGNSADPSVPNTPFLGSLDAIPLQGLTRTDTASLIADPFRKLDIPLRSPDIVERVWSSTAGYPFLVQFYGERLFRIATSRSRPEVLFDDVVEVENGFDLHDFLAAHFIENTIAHGRPLVTERLCAALFAQSGDSSWAEGDFMAACLEHKHLADMSDIHSALRNLYNAKILSFSGGNYTFALPKLCSVLKQSYPRIEPLLRSVEGR